MPKQLKVYPIPVELKIEGISPKHTENLRLVILELFTKNPEILEEEKSPQDILQILGFNTSEIETQPQKGKWAYVAEELATKDTLPPEADEILEEGKKWRQNFRIPRKGLALHLRKRGQARFNFLILDFYTNCNV